MFIEKHRHNLNNGELEIDLAFIKSANILAYPCGRRRSTLIEVDTDGNKTIDERYYLPFDPEARLNTEANNRKHSSINGFTQTYLNDWNVDKGVLSLSLAGYLFTITLDAKYQSYEAFAAGVTDNSDATAIYANILTQEVPLFTGFKSYNTSMLRNQSNTNTSEPSSSLDLINSEKFTDKKEFNNYYFSGLSFSTDPLSGNTMTSPKHIYETDDTGNAELHQTIVSLKILEKVDGEWQIYEPSRLPKIEHGSEVDSVKVTIFDAQTIRQDNKPVPTIDLVEKDGAWQLQISKVTLN